MFWSGASFGVKELVARNRQIQGCVRNLYDGRHEIRANDMARWLKKAKDIQWDYKNIVKRKGKLIRMAQK
jgi:acylphosphatase